MYHPIQKICRLQVVLVLSCLLALTANAQDAPSPKYTVGIFAGAHSTLARRGPQGETAVSKVHFLHPVPKLMGLDFTLSLNDRWALGAIFSYDEFDFGYQAELYESRSGLGIQSGLLAANSTIGIYKLGPHLQYTHRLSRRFSIYGRLAPTLGFLPYSPYLEDTASNAGRRSPRREVWYVVKPTVQNNSLKFIAFSQIGVLYDMGKHFQIGLSMHYQKGFSPIVRDTTTIIRDGLTTPRQVDYWTVVDGSAIGGQLRINYRF